MLIIRNLNLISVQSWAYLERSGEGLLLLCHARNCYALARAGDPLQSAKHCVTERGQNLISWMDTSNRLSFAQ